MHTVNKHIEREVSSFYKKLREVLHFTGKSKNIDFYISSLIEYNPFYTTEEIAQWLFSLNQEQPFCVTQIPLTEMDKWSFNKNTGDLQHDSGGFFSIKGLRVRTNFGDIPFWSQPIIYQPEIGILGVITKKINGILYFLMQAKAEPGNLYTYQLSPTVQATQSNYLRRHSGKKTLYIEYFFDNSIAEILVDQLQSEQGARFYHKRNRNIIMRIPDDHKIELGKNHRWLTLGQILKLAQKDNTVNMDTRSVISSINYEPESVTSKKPVEENELKKCLEVFSLASNSNFEIGVKLMISNHPNSFSLHMLDKILIEISQRKFMCELDVQLIPLKKVIKWIQTSIEIYHPERRFFSVIGVHIEAMNREVPSWDQPIIKQDYHGIVAFIAKEMNGIVHFLTQLKVECGVMDLMEIAPTVQCITSNYEKDDMPKYVDDVIQCKNLKVVLDVNQSEEGGRFYKESNRNMILLADDSFPVDEPTNFIWMSINQLKQLIKFNNFLNVETRSVLSCIPTN